jgi:hypothetical protein
MRRSKFTLPLDPTSFAWPYSGILNDLRAAISGKANFLAALGLLVYTEVIGLWILDSRGTKKSRNDDCFYVFFEDYMGRQGARRREVYELFRHGLAHGYAFNAADLSRVLMRADPDWIPTGSRPAIVAFQRRRLKSFLVNAYFRDFQRGLANWAAERPDLVVK